MLGPNPPPSPSPFPILKTAVKSWRIGLSSLPETARFLPLLLLVAHGSVGDLRFDPIGLIVIVTWWALSLRARFEPTNEPQAALNIRRMIRVGSMLLIVSALFNLNLAWLGPRLVFLQLSSPATVSIWGEVEPAVVGLAVIVLWSWVAPAIPALALDRSRSTGDVIAATLTATKGKLSAHMAVTILVAAPPCMALLLVRWVAETDWIWTAGLYELAWWIEGALTIVLIIVLASASELMLLRARPELTTARSNQDAPPRSPTVEDGFMTGNIVRAALFRMSRHWKALAVLALSSAAVQWTSARLPWGWSPSWVGAILVLVATTILATVWVLVLAERGGLRSIVSRAPAGSLRILVGLGAVAAVLLIVSASWEIRQGLAIVVGLGLSIPTFIGCGLLTVAILWLIALMPAIVAGLATEPCGFRDVHVRIVALGRDRRWSIAAVSWPFVTGTMAVLLIMWSRPAGRDDANDPGSLAVFLVLLITAAMSALVGLESWRRATSPIDPDRDPVTNYLSRLITWDAVVPAALAALRRNIPAFAVMILLALGGAWLAAPSVIPTAWPHEIVRLSIALVFAVACVRVASREASVKWGTMWLGTLVGTVRTGALFVLVVLAAAGLKLLALLFIASGLFIPSILSTAPMTGDDMLFVSFDTATVVFGIGVFVLGQMLLMAPPLVLGKGGIWTRMKQATTAFSGRWVDLVSIVVVSGFLPATMLIYLWVWIDRPKDFLAAPDWSYPAAAGLTFLGLAVVLGVATELYLRINAERASTELSP